MNSTTSPPLSFTGKRWIVPPESAAAEGLIDHLKLQRGMGAEEAEICVPVYPAADAAEERLERAIRAQERIGIFGDYDCDGITAAALLIRMLRRRAVDPVVRLPHRERDGYGLKPEHVDAFAALGITLLLTVDTGINARAAAERAAEKGIDVIVFDHHECGGELPRAAAILHPSFAARPPASAPCAAGVVYQFVSFFEGGAWRGQDEDAALAMIGTVADLVPLKGWNRSIVQEGLGALRGLRHGPLAELAAAVRSAGRALSSVDVAFRIAPRINAAGRMADPLLGLRAVLEGGRALREIETLNADRQTETMTCIDDALLRLPYVSPQLPRDLFLCVASERYQPGIIGLIAGKLTERFGRPSLAACIRGGICTASLRSPKSYHVTEALGRCGHLLTSFGGHRQAAGCTFPASALPALHEALRGDIAARLSPEDLHPSVAIDAVIPPSAATLSLAKALGALEPFGQENPEPNFLLRHVTMSDLRAVGGASQHLQALAAGHKAIGFGLGHLMDRLDAPVDLACRIEVDNWNGREQVQLVIQDIRTYQDKA